LGQRELLPVKLSVMFACSRGQQSFESDKVRHGVFTYFLLEGLNGRARDESGEVSWLDLATYVMKSVPRRLPELMDSEDLAQAPIDSQSKCHAIEPRNN